eukprot:TRINITY_DN16420_c0_g1_i3.p1 TRINITY_DN16420_c0_g1~~TRINITY_DN16420_c0_g1_i3.p1  ORF type:complete len:120 (+),score=12.06 TRINITY_DN16420_c0_g1_i3:168-527(+)
MGRDMARCGQPGLVNLCGFIQIIANPPWLRCFPAPVQHTLPQAMVEMVASLGPWQGSASCNPVIGRSLQGLGPPWLSERPTPCLLYTSDAADEEDSVDLGGRRIIKKKKYRNRQTSTDN